MKIIKYGSEYGIKHIAMTFSAQMFSLIMIFMAYNKPTNLPSKNYRFNLREKEQLIDILLSKVPLLKIIHKGTDIFL